MGYVESYKQAEQEFTTIIEAADKMRHEGFEQLQKKTEDLVQDMSRAEMLEHYTAKNELDARAKSLMVACWIKTHKDEATNGDMMLAAFAFINDDSDDEEDEDE